MTILDTESELKELLEQVNYALSDKFKEKWRHRFSTNFVSIFQDRLLKALKTRKPVTRSSIKSLYTKQHKYSPSEVRDFFKLIDLSLYYPLVILD